MRSRVLSILILLCSCSEETAINPGTHDAAPDAPFRADAHAADLTAPHKDAAVDAAADTFRGEDAAVDAATDSSKDNNLAQDLPSPDLARVDAWPMDHAVDRAVADLANENLQPDLPTGAQDAAGTADGSGGEAGPSCQSAIPGLQGDTVGEMASQCSWPSPSNPSTPAATIAFVDVAEAMSFRIQVDIAPEVYAHQGYVSAPSLAEVGPLSGPGMEVLGPSPGAGQGQYLFDLRWANQTAPREGLQITLTATFSLACAPALSRTIAASTTLTLALCRSPSGKLVWRGLGQSCAACDPPVDAGTDGSADGPLRWQQVQVASGFPARMAHVGLVFKDKMWILGGEDATGKDQNDVWSSSDGSHWSLAASAAAWSPRSLHRGVVFHDKMWIVDGVRGSDVWSSEDGVRWTKVVEPAAFPARYAGQVVSFADKMWLIGGYGSSGEPMNDVWSSVDGAVWTLAVASAPWTARDLHTCLVANGKLWIIDGERLGDVWSSSDGSHWDQVTQIAAFPGRMSHSSVVFQDKLWILGGYGRAGSPIDDVWMSTDGATWVQQAIHAPWGPRQFSAAMVFQDKTWLIGGSDGDRRLGDIWTLESM